MGARINYIIFEETNKKTYGLVLNQRRNDMHPGFLEVSVAINTFFYN